MKFEQQEPRAETLRLRDITADPRAQMRAGGLSDEHIGAIREAMRLGKVMPPVVVFREGKTDWLADGFHRKVACEFEEIDSIEAKVYDGTLRDAILYACQANADHGKQRSPGDKHKAVRTLLSDPEWSQWSTSDIATHCQVGQEMVRDERKAMGLSSRARRCVRGGTEYTMNTANIGITMTDVLNAQRERQAAEDDEEEEQPTRQPITSRRCPECGQLLPA